MSPSETNALSPIPRRDAPSIAAAPNAPLWETKPIVPAGTSARANVAVRRHAGSVLTTPMQFGPTSRIPVDRQTSSSSASRAAPSAPGLGEAGGDHDERADARLGALARDARARCSAGTATIARSTGPGVSFTDADARREPTKSAFGLTG